MADDGTPGGGTHGGSTLGEVYFEFIAIGAVVKVSAIDPVSGLEVSVTGPARAARSDLERVALRKLKVQLARRAAR